MFSRVEIYNMVISLENRIPIIALNDVRGYFALVDILLSSQLSDLRRAFEIQALAVFWRPNNSKHRGIKFTQQSFFRFHGFPLLILYFFSFDVRIKILWPLCCIIAPTVTELVLLRNANSVVSAPLLFFVYLMYKP